MGTQNYRELFIFKKKKKNGKRKVIFILKEVWDLIQGLLTYDESIRKKRL